MCHIYEVWNLRRIRRVRPLKTFSNTQPTLAFVLMLHGCPECHWLPWVYLPHSVHERFTWILFWSPPEMSLGHLLEFIYLSHSTFSPPGMQSGICGAPQVVSQPGGANARLLGALEQMPPLGLLWWSHPSPVVMLGTNTVLGTKESVWQVGPLTGISSQQVPNLANTLPSGIDHASGQNWIVPLVKKLGEFGGSCSSKTSEDFWKSLLTLLWRILLIPCIFHLRSPIPIVFSELLGNDWSLLFKTHFLEFQSNRVAQELQSRKATFLQGHCLLLCPIMSRSLEWLVVQKLI